MNEKYCPDCEETKSVTKFHANKARKDGLNSVCIECWRIRRKERRINGNIVTKKKCSSCGERKAFDKFYRNRTKSDGCDNYCIPCRKDYTSLYHKGN